MNIYSASFVSRCPVNGDNIEYELKIRSPHLIKAEAIEAEIRNIPADFHEEIADRLHRRLGGHQVVRAKHGGVWIETHRPRRNLICRIFGHRYETVACPEAAQGWGIWCGECSRCGSQTSDSCR